MDIADTIMERPYEFHIGEMQFYLYPATLGKIYLLSRLTENLEKIKTKLQLYLNKMASGEFYINGKDCYGYIISFLLNDTVTFKRVHRKQVSIRTWQTSPVL